MLHKIFTFVKNGILSKQGLLGVNLIEKLVY
jgi:hypothetical protein